MATTNSGLRPAAPQRTEKQRVSLTRSLNNGQHTLLSKDTTKPLPFPPPRLPSTRRSATPNSRSHSNDDNDAGRVRVPVRGRPRNAEDLVSDADFADYVELQPELSMAANGGAKLGGWFRKCKD